MNSARWEQIQSLFHHVADLPIYEGYAFLTRECRNDPSLIAEVLNLIKEDSRDGGLLDRGPAHAAYEILSEQVGQVVAGSQFGSYRIVRLLGEGGMGVVYLAKREDLGNPVAIKFLRDAFLSPTRRDRFNDEQRMLAQLNHPSIARLYDAGTLTDGVPWFVMEYVEGIPLTGYCQAHASSIPQRLKLFRSVCEAVTYAHGQALIHRDLKPSNILVKEDGTIKLLDFGIAKQLNGPGAIVDRTRTLWTPLTPGYAAPEQIRGEPATVATDVYSLGVILYELLSEHFPFDFTSKTPGEIEEAILNQDPLKPSQFTHESRDRMSKSSWTDLDVLCVTAMHKDPQRRYRSPEALIRDLDHYLAHEPLQARPDNFQYRLVKFVTRNRRQVIAATAVIATIIGLSLWFTVRLITARNRALSSEAQTQRIHKLMLNLFDGDDDAAGPAKELRVVDLLDRGVQQAQTLNGEPQLQAQLQYTFGTLFEKLGHYARAEPLLLSALRQQRALLGGENPDTISTQLALARLRKDQSRFADAQRLITQVLTQEKPKYASDSVEIAKADGALGLVLQARGDYKNALVLLSRSRNVLKKNSPSSDLSEVLSGLADNYYYVGDSQSAAALYQEVLALDRSLFGPHHPNVAVDLYDLANLELDSGKYTEAEALLRQALAINSSWYGEAHGKTAESLTGLGAALIGQKRYDEAGMAFERALAATAATAGEQSLKYGVVLGLMGDLAKRQQQLDKAEKLYSKSTDILRRTAGEKSEFFAIQLSSLASILVLKHEYGEAEKLLRAALQILQAAVPAERYTGLTEIRLAAALTGEKRYVEAESQALAGYRILQRLTGADSLEQKSARKVIYDVYIATNQPDKAKPFASK